MTLDIQWLPDPETNKLTHCPDCGDKLLFPGYDEEQVEKFYSEDHIMIVERLDERLKVGMNLYNAAVKCRHCGHAYLSSFNNMSDEKWSLSFTISK